MRACRRRARRRRARDRSAVPRPGPTSSRPARSQLLRKVPTYRAQVASRCQRGAHDHRTRLRRLEELALARGDRGVRDALVTEEEQVTWPRCVHGSALHRLLVGITIETYPIQTVHELCEPGTVDPVCGRAAPEIRHAEETFGR